MATGRATAYGGGVIDQADVRGAGDLEWASLIGIAPDHPLVSEGGSLPYNISASHSRIVTTPSGQSGAATAGGLAATPDAYGHAAVKHLDDWRDLFNLKGSPMPWLLIIAVGIVLFAHASVQARAGAFGKRAAVGAALG